MNDINESEKQSFLDESKESGDVAKVITKLLKESVVVEFNKRQDELDVLELDELTLKENKIRFGLENTDDSKQKIEQIDQILDEINTKREEIRKEKESASLVPLKYRDLRVVQTSIQEALMATEGMGFDTNTRIAMVIQEKKLMTIYLSLKKLGNSDERYFSSLEDIIKVSDKVIEKLYEIYSKEFVLTETERKN